MHDNSPTSRQSPDEYIDQLYRRHAAAARRAASQILGHDVDAADDVVQIVFLRMLNACRTGALIDCSRNYVLRAVRNAAIDRLRLSGKAQFVQLPTTTVDSHDVAPDRSVERLELRMALEAAIAELPERCREVAERCYLDEFSQSEAALELGMSQKAAAKQISRARKSLRKRLRPFRRPPQGTTKPTAGGGERGSIVIGIEWSATA